MTRHAFDANGIGAEALALTMLVSVEQQGDTCVAAYIVQNLVKTPNGSIKGQIAPTNMDYPVFFFDEIDVVPAMITDWRYTEEGNGTRFGHLSLRSLYTGDLDALADAGLAGPSLPPDWQ